MHVQDTAQAKDLGQGDSDLVSKTVLIRYQE